jgi:hypothetical protein
MNNTVSYRQAPLVSSSRRVPEWLALPWLSRNSHRLILYNMVWYGFLRYYIEG